jgi:hypothetical protein
MLERQWTGSQVALDNFGSVAFTGHATLASGAHIGGWAQSGRRSPLTHRRCREREPVEHRQLGGEDRHVHLDVGEQHPHRLVHRLKGRSASERRHCISASSLVIKCHVISGVSNYTARATEADLMRCVARHERSEQKRVLSG